HHRRPDGKLGPAEQLDFEVAPRAAGPENVVDQRFHCVISIPKRRAHPIPLPGVALGQHEMVHPSIAGVGIANARGDAGAEHGGDHLVNRIRYVVGAWKKPDHMSPSALVETLDWAADRGLFQLDACTTPGSPCCCTDSHHATI